MERKRVWGAPAALMVLCAAACDGKSSGGAPADTDDGDAVDLTDSVEGDDAAPGDYPDPAFVFDPGPRETFARDERYFDKRGEQWLASDALPPGSAKALPDADVRAIAIVGAETWLGTASGVLRAGADGRYGRVTGLPQNPVVDIAVAGADVFVAYGREVRRADGTEVLAAADSPGDIRAVAAAVAGGVPVLFVAAAEGAGRIAGADKTFERRGAYRAVDCNADGCAWVRDDGTVERTPLSGLGVTTSLTTADGLPDADVRAVAVAPAGRMFVGSATGLTIVTGETVRRVIKAEPGGLPYDKIRALAANGSVVLMAHEIGATVIPAYPGDTGPLSGVEHYASGRYVPDRAVAAVGLAGDDPRAERLIGTPAGLGRITFKQMTLAQKADEMQAAVDDRYWRMDGFVSPGAVADRVWEPTAFTRDDSDNDGLWTQMQVGGFCFAYAATGDERYYRAGKKAMDVMMKLVDVPGVTFSKIENVGYGFITRSLARFDETELWQRLLPTGRWHEVTFENVRYLWKDDTSSDETTGHFFGFPLYYDLCAKTPEEKAAVAQRATALADTIRRNGYRLLDQDGEPTTWGRWEPSRYGIIADGYEACNDRAAGSLEALSDCTRAWFGAGWLQATQILGHMLAAWHMSGDTKFYDAYRELIEVYGYDRVALLHKDVKTVYSRRLQNHSDHELAYLAYYTLVRYEPDDARRAYWIEQMQKLYEVELPERNPLWVGIHAMAQARGYNAEMAAQALRDIPADLREWPVDNSHRKDAKPDGVGRFSEAQFDRVFPYDEIRTMWWNGNPYVAKSGGNPRSHQGPMFWLLPHWMLRYHGALLPPTSSR